MRKLVSVFMLILIPNLVLASRFARINLPHFSTIEKVPLSNWHNLSTDDGVEGIGTEKTYLTFGEPSDEDLIVAVVDGGINVNHEDLQGKIWINHNEIENNGIDDDQNGYIDDVFGWNFVGNPSGMAKVVIDNSLENGLKLINGDPAGQVQFDNSEMTREVIRMKAFEKEKKSKGEELSREEKNYLERIQYIVSFSRQKAQETYESLKNDLNILIESSLTLKKEGLLSINLSSVTAFICSNLECEKAKKSLIDVLSNYPEEMLREKVREAEREVWAFREDFFPYAIVNDDNGNLNVRHYGNNDVIGSDPDHGTQIAGLIAANRKNNLGILGVAENVKIMAVKVIPEGDGRTKDIANGIFYAVDNGAKIINLSLASDFETPHEYYLDEAIKYAEERDVLIVHAAGNESIDLDIVPNFPNRIYEKEKREFSNWIAVGSTYRDFGQYLNVPFSNYGKTSVDVLAPGLFLETTTGLNEYDTASGTSMSAPLVAGAAALILSYKPDLSAKEIKSLLIKTSRKYPELMVAAWGDQNENRSQMPFRELSAGGIIDIYEAVTSSRQISSELELLAP